MQKYTITAIFTVDIDAFTEDDAREAVLDGVEEIESLGGTVSHCTILNVIEQP